MNEPRPPRTGDGWQSRRRFLQTSVAGAAALGSASIGSIALAQSDAVRLAPTIEPLVRLLETTSRGEVLEALGARVRSGLDHDQLLAALLLAGVRNIQPRPVGFKFHAVLVVHAVHLASRNLPPADRWLPLFWAVDDFKASQFRDVLAGDWQLPPVNERLVPGADQARQAFERAMEAWDEPAADVAAAGIVRHLPASQCLALLSRYGARDYRDIGHKAIYVANAWRTLQTIGWQHAEAVVRSIAYAQLDYRGWSHPATSDAPADRSWRHNLTVVDRIRPGWQEGKLEMAPAIELLDTLRAGADADASAQVVALLNRAVAPQAIADACHLFAAELMMKRPGILALHAITTTNALQVLYRANSDDRLRRLLLLQNAAMLTHFRDDTLSHDEKRAPIIDRFAAMAIPNRGSAIEAIMAEAARDRAAAVRMTLGYLRSAGADAKALLDAAQRLIALKGNNAHDYKYSAAVFEDYGHVSHLWRDRYLAAAMQYLTAPQANDNPLVARTRAALGARVPTA